MTTAALPVRFIDQPGALRPLLVLAAPVLVEQMLHLLVGISDTWLTAYFLADEAYLAAMTLMVYLLWAVGNLIALVAHGSTALAARFFGARDLPAANQVMHQSLTCGAMWTALLMLMLFPLADELVTAMGLTGKAAEAATEYLRIELCVLPFIMVERVAIACLRAAGDTVSGLVVMAIVNVVNMALSYALCVGFGPFPELGWRGIALGTALGHCCGGALLLALLAAGRAGYRLRLSQLWPDFAMIRRILRIGIPAGLDSMLLVACQFLYVRIVNSLGDVASAAHGVALQVEAIAYMPGGAFQIAASTVVGQYLGAGEPQRAARSVLWACAAASVIMGSAGLVFFFAGESLVGLFFADGNRAVIPLAAEALRIITLVLVPLAITMVTSGALRGAGDTFWPLVFTLLGLAVVRVPLASYLALDHFRVPLTGIEVDGLGWGLAGAWTAASCDVLLRCALTAGRFLQGGWAKVKV